MDGITQILNDLRERLIAADEEAAESSKAAMNSYGAGYDAGYAAAIREILNELTGEN